MKRLMVFMVAFLAIQQAWAQPNPFNQTDSIQISGKIIGYSPQQAQHFITFSTYNLFGKSTTEAIQIEDDGRYWIKLYQPFEGDIRLNYKNAYINIYTRPNKTLQLDIYDDKVNRENNFEGAFIAKGELADINNLMFKFAAAFSSHSFKIRPDMGDKKQTDSAFAASTIAKLNEELIFLHNFVKNNQITNQKFIEWQRNELCYQAGRDILFFPFAGKLNRDITQGQLLKMIDTIPINNSSAFNNSSYYMFLNSLGGCQQIMININPVYQALKAENGKNTIGICLDEIDKFASGLTKELMYFSTYIGKAGSSSDPMPFLSRFNKTITNLFLKQQLSETQKPSTVVSKKFDVVARLNALKVGSSLKQRLINLFTNYKGTSLYLDFWGDWCGPCMTELPNYPKLITTLAGKPIKFLFLSTFTTEKSMMAIKQKFGIDGDFVNLTNDEVKIVNNVFQFHSYPSHFMVDHNGLVVSSTWKMSSTTINQKVKEIEAFLARKE